MFLPYPAVSFAFCRSRPAPAMIPLAHLAIFSVFSSVMAKPFGRSSHAAVDVLCPAFNLNTTAACDGSQLLRTANPSQSVIQCQYLDGDLCSYSRGNGIIQNGSATCPPSIDTSDSGESFFACNKSHLKQSPLMGSSITAAAENLACIYGDATLCTYSQHTGTLSTGASLCPRTAISSGDCPASSSTVATPYGSKKENSKSGSSGKSKASADKNLLASNSDSARSPLSPGLIALLVLNGVLVLGVLVIGAVWLGRRRIRPRCEPKYYSVGPKPLMADPDAASVPLTHGAPGRYYDAFEAPPSNAPSRARRTSQDDLLED
ncbi:hypothetical protein B0H13DRAFT_2651668 [Mycena leptocephala]|nr:hypothetical protein B0H13DRAFT_2651668 [Mycena leptocephala]